MPPWGGDSRQSCIAVYWSEAPLQEWREGAAGTHGAPCNIARSTPVGGQHLTTCCLVRMATEVGNAPKNLDRSTPLRSFFAMRNLLFHKSRRGQVHAGHQELVVAGVLHNALAALGGFRLVHVVVGVDFGVVLLQGVTVHQITDDKHVC